MPNQNKKAQENFRKNFDLAFGPKRFKDRVDLGLSPCTDVTWVDLRGIKKQKENEDEQTDER